MPQDMLSDLKAKEEELDALIEGARQKAASIREQARKKVDEIRASHAAAIEQELTELRKKKDERIRAEVAGIEKQSETEVEDLKARCEANIDRAVAEVTRLISGEDGQKQ